MRNEINKMVFENNEVEVAVINSEILFEIYSVGFALGYQNKRKNGKGVEYITPYKSRIDKTLESADITCVCHGVTQYLTESQLYDFMLEARTDKCKSFRKWITQDVIPQIRSNGGYVDEDSTMQERESLKLKPMSMRAITKSIHECPIMELEKLVSDIIEANINSGKRGRVDKQLRDLDATEYKQHVRKHIRQAVESKPYSNKARDHALDIVVRDRVVIDLLDDIQETTNRKFAQLV